MTQQLRQSFVLFWSSTFAFSLWHQWGGLSWQSQTVRGLQLQAFLMFFCLMFFAICLRRSSYIARKHCHLGHAAKELRLHTEGSVVHAVTTTLENARETVCSSSLRRVFDFKTPFWEGCRDCYPFPAAVWIPCFKPAKWARREDLRISTAATCRSLLRCFLNLILYFCYH